MTRNYNLVLGYELDKWHGYEIKEPIAADISTKTNTHALICGISGSGKSFATNILFAKRFWIRNRATKK